MDPRLVDVLVKLVVAGIGLLAMFIEVYGVKWAKMRLAEARIRFGEEQIETAKNIAAIIVDAVEAMGAAGIINYKGKFAEALRRVKDMATAKNIVLTDDQWQSMIEAAVASMKRIGDELKKAPAA